MKAFERFKDDLDPERCCWSENKDKFKRVTQVIRIFYVKGPSAGEQIGTSTYLGSRQLSLGLKAFELLFLP